jgi:hypothetical protein
MDTQNGPIQSRNPSDGRTGTAGANNLSISPPIEIDTARGVIVAVGKGKQPSST